MKVKLGIVGASSTQPSAYQQVYDVVKAELNKVGKDNLELVSGGATGVDSIAEQVASDLGIPIKVFKPKSQTWEHFKERNIQIANYSTRVVSFANKLSTTKCYHCENANKDNNHQKTAGCYTGYKNGNYQTIIL